MFGFGLVRDVELKISESIWRHVYPWVRLGSRMFTVSSTSYDEAEQYLACYFM